MTKMSIEEKAKAYDEALERARANYKADKEMGFLENCDMLELIFPELRESEDEMHRKWILEYLYDGLRKADEQFKDHFKSAIDWLERKKIPSVSLNPALGFDPGSAVVYHNDESENERIIEEIKFAVMQMPSERQDTKDRCLAWLEKQKESLVRPTN